MAILKFKRFEDLDRLEREGRGINWRFTTNEVYLNKVLKVIIKVPFPPGVYKFKTFEEAETWEREWWVKSGDTKRTRQIMCST